MKTFVLSVALLSTVIICHSQTTPIYHGKLQSDLDGGGNSITNVNIAGVQPASATLTNWSTRPTNQFAAVPATVTATHFAAFGASNILNDSGVGPASFDLAGISGSNSASLSNSLSGQGNIFGGYNSPNSSSNNIQTGLWKSNATFTSGVPPNVPIASVQMVSTNLMLAGDNSGAIYTNMGNGGAGVLFSAIRYTNGNFHAVSTVTIPTNFPATGYFMVGFSTNLTGSPAANRTLGIQYASTNQGFCFGLMMTNSGFQFFNLTTTGGRQIEGSFGVTNFLTPGTYTFDLGTDASNAWVNVIYPAHTNEMRTTMPLSGLYAGSTLITNLVMGIWGSTNCGTLVSSGWRYGSQSINPPTGVENLADYVGFSQDAHVCVGSTLGGDQIEYILPAQYDSLTNPAKGAINISHGNGGTYKDYREGIPIDISTNNDNPWMFFSNLLANNYILFSYYGDQSNAGRIDTWGTTNSIKCNETGWDYLKAHFTFNLRIGWGISAGGATASGYAGTHPGSLDALIMQYSVFSIFNQYSAGQTNDIGIAYGATNSTVFASQDPASFPASAFAGLPIMCIASSGDNIVTKAAHTDLLVNELGGTPGVDSIGTIGLLTPEVNDFVVAGANGMHGGQCYNTAAGQAVIAFLSRVPTYVGSRHGVYNGTFSGLGSGLTNIPSTSITGGFTTNIQFTDTLIGTTNTLYFTNGILMRTTSP